MSIFWWILIVIGIIIGIFLLVIIITILSLFLSSSSSNPDDCINDNIKFVKNFMGYDFGDKYSILEHYLHRSHPDQPMKLTLEFLKEDFQGILSYINGLEMKETRYYNRKKDVIYIDEWKKDFNFPDDDDSPVEHTVIKSHHAYHHSKEGDFIFFMASLTININKHSIRYVESMI